MITVKPGESVTVAAEELGELTSAFLMVYNSNEDLTVEFV